MTRDRAGRDADRVDDSLRESSLLAEQAASPEDAGEPNVTEAAETPRPYDPAQPLSIDNPLPAEIALTTHEPILLTVEARAHGWRIDHYLTRVFPNYSRGLFQSAIEQGRVLINNLQVKPSRRLRVNDRVAVTLPEQPDSSLPAEDLPLDILYEDEAIIVLNKAAGMITHPGRGNYRGTLAGALQFHFDKLSDVAGKLRPGIVHRLDRDTSGVLVVAKDNQIHNRLSQQFEQRDVRKEYRALVWGVTNFDSDYIETHMRVNPAKREKMMVCEPGGNAREATTFYETLERFRGFSHVRLLPHTGRTHQLRVHMSHIGHPIIADRVYGGRAGLWLGDLTQSPNAPIDRSFESPELLISRQALHAFRLEFDHPDTGKRLTFEAPLPEDFTRTLEALREHCPPM